MEVGLNEEQQLNTSNCYWGRYYIILGYDLRFLIPLAFCYQYKNQK